MLPGDSKEMNENIKNLWDATLEEFSKEHQFATIMLPEPLKEKFAELIVRECVGILEPKSRYMGEGPEVLKDKIKQINRHFGVKEK
jgi:hypothetical protein